MCALPTECVCTRRPSEPRGGPDNTISVEPEPRGSIQQWWMRGCDGAASGSAQRRRNKLGCHCRLTGLIMLYNLLCCCRCGGLCIILCASAPLALGRLHTRGEEHQQRQEEGAFCRLLPSWHPLDSSWLESGTNRGQSALLKEPPSQRGTDTESLDSTTKGGGGNGLFLRGRADRRHMTGVPK